MDPALASALPEADLSSGCAFVTWPSSFEPCLMLVHQRSCISIVRCRDGVAGLGLARIDGFRERRAHFRTASRIGLSMPGAAEAVGVLLLVALAPLRLR